LVGEIAHDLFALVRRVVTNAGIERVIGLRIAKLAGGGIDAEHEAHLILSEKVGAVFELSARLATGATLIDVVDRFREQVAANARRLS
jgi:hypothetical protein